MKPWMKWASVAVAPALLAGGVVRALHTRQQQQAAVAAAALTKPI